MNNASNMLVDTFGRAHEYLRISVTERCNLRCRYCMPPEGVPLRQRGEMLSFDEIEALARLFVRLGIRKIRLTGGEPLVRNGIEDLCRRLAAIEGLRSLALTTNGVLLAEKAQALRRAGVKNLNISLDTLKREKFENISLRNGFDAVVRGIESALGAGFESVKINTVVMNGFNDDELVEFVEFARALSLNVRFIEYMPFLGNKWNDVTFMPYSAMRSVIESKYTLIPVGSAEVLPGPAKEFRVGGSDAVIGFITTMSEHFCGSCNRLRVSADGRLRNCLFATQAGDLRELLRNGAPESMLTDRICSVVHAKWAQHPETGELVQQQSSSMTVLGG